MKECKFYFDEIVYVDFEDHKIIGKVQSHRITDTGMILYNVSLAGLYVPPTMVHKLTEAQETAYFELLKKYDGINKTEVFTEEMQEIFKREE
ncbi:hypothetical protein G9F71_008610 [Clostridium sp. FP2]|uniref:hypothetical protein n=1 Tax=Clostridium sp. FP2 TaxID=2724481 RepID=UPI0013E95CF9|nr:hypothetical protein [Clostridium sp. FP2]MBZ9622914.1 hypothetical protein [Clostridium sp. FP2]